MSGIGLRYRKMVLSLTAGVWTQVVAPIDCNDIWIKCRGADTVRECTDAAPNGSTAYDIIQVGVLQSLGPFLLVESGTGLMFGNSRFKKDDVITNLSADITSPTICVVTFVL